MKTFSSLVNDIVASNASKTAKKQALIKLGITSYEIDQILLINAPSSAFKASALTFGVEIECYNVLRSELIAQVRSRSIAIESEGYNHQDNERYYKIVSDCSINGANGQEVVSPILKGNNGMDSLKNVCESLNAIGAMVNRSTGLHVHFDASNISDKHFVNIFKNYQKIESVIDSFMPMSRRGRNNHYCDSLSRINYSFCETKMDVIRNNGTRYLKVNAESYLRHKTIEFRQHSGTVEYNKISHWIKFLRKLIEYSHNHVIEECSSIEEIPFLSETEKKYFINRREALN